MSPALPPLALPLLSRRAALSSCDEGLLVDCEECALTFHGPGAAALKNLHDEVDGTHRLDALVQRSASPGELRAVLSVLRDEGLVLDAAATEEAASMKDWLVAYVEECRFWSRELFAQPFWQKVLSGQASQSLILGWGLEFFHYVESANEHMAMAVAQCRTDGELRRWLADHYADEYNHGAIFLQGLAASGLERQQVQAAPPLASTRALIDFLTELAGSDVQAYLGAFGVMQSSREGMTRQSLGEFYGLLSRHYPFASGMFSAFERHAALDVGLQHQGAPPRAAVCPVGDAAPGVLAEGGGRGPRHRRTLHAVLRGDRQLLRVPGASVPRRPLDIRVLT